MHLCNENAEKWAPQLAEIRANKRLTHAEKTPSAPSSCAGFLTDGEKTVPINLDKLRDEHKRPTWEWIKKNQPDLAVLLSQDQQFADFKQQLNQAFNATVVVRIPEAAAKQLGIIR